MYETAKCLRLSGKAQPLSSCDVYQDVLNDTNFQSSHMKLLRFTSSHLTSVRCDAMRSGVV